MRTHSTLVSWIKRPASSRENRKVVNPSNGTHSRHRTPTAANGYPNGARWSEAIECGVDVGQSDWTPAVMAILRKRRYRYQDDTKCPQPSAQRKAAPVPMVG